MRRFHWRLQRVLDIKKKQEQTKRAQLVEITERLSQARGQLFMQKRILADLIDHVSEGDLQDRVNRQAFFMTWSAANNDKIKTLEDDIKTLAAKQQEKIQDIMKIKQFNDGLEKLREQAREEFFKDQQMQEQKELDQTATVRFARKAITQSAEVPV